MDSALSSYFPLRVSKITLARFRILTATTKTGIAVASTTSSTGNPAIPPLFCVPLEELEFEFEFVLPEFELPVGGGIETLALWQLEMLDSPLALTAVTT